MGRPSTPPDVVVTEWEMPRLNGLDLCRAVRADPELGGTHVIVLTTGGSGHRTAEALEAGADDYVTVPFDEAELLAGVRTGRRTAQLRALGVCGHLGEERLACGSLLPVAVWLLARAGVVEAQPQVAREDPHRCSEQGPRRAGRRRR